MKPTIALLGVLVFAGALQVAGAQTASSLQGTWRVTDVTVTGEGAPTNQAPQPGLYIFGKGYYSIVTVNGTAARKNVANAANPAKLTDAEKMARFEVYEPFTANSGTYQVAGSTLTTHPMVAKNPSVMGTTQTRTFKIDGATLTLVQKSATGQPVSQTTTRLTRVE